MVDVMKTTDFYCTCMFDDVSDGLVFGQMINSDTIIPMASTYQQLSIMSYNE